MLFIMLLAVLAEGYMLYRIHGIQAFRQCSSRFSNGDENTVNIRVESSYPYAVSVEVIDEIPFIFQQRNIGESTILDGFVYLYKAGWDYFRAAIPVVIAKMSKSIHPT